MYTTGSCRSRWGSSMRTPAAAGVIARWNPSDGRKPTIVVVDWSIVTSHVSLTCVWSHWGYSPAALMFHGQRPVFSVALVAVLYRSTRLSFTRYAMRGVSGLRLNASPISPQYWTRRQFSGVSEE